MAFGGPRSSCVRPGARSARHQDSRKDLTPCRMALHFVSAGAHAPHSDETLGPTAGGRRTPLVAYAPSLSCAPPRKLSDCADPCPTNSSDTLPIPYQEYNQVRISLKMSRTGMSMAPFENRERNEIRVFVSRLERFQGRNFPRSLLRSEAIHTRSPRPVGSPVADGATDVKTMGIVH